MIALVRGVMAFSISSGSMLYVRGSMSTKTGVAPVRTIDIAHLAEQVNRNDRLGAGRDGLLYQFGIDVIRARIDVDKDRGGARADDRYRTFGRTGEPE